MNGNLNGSAPLGQDTPMAQSNGASYSGDQWTSISPYSQSPYNNSPLSEFSPFGPYGPHGLPLESLNRMPPPPVHPQTPHPLIQPAPPIGHHQLPMLNTQWPSQLANPTQGSYSAPPLSIPPLSLPPVEAHRPPMPHEKARKTLSAEQKRAMCLFHEENPGTRQADIGARFGVERSTVSKVLRHKDQYLKRDTESDPASIKRNKGKHPDFDRTLINFLRRRQDLGFEIKDEEIMEQARCFARASSNHDNIPSGLNGNWLQKFKQKHGIGSSRLMRRASETNIPDSMTMSTALHNHPGRRNSSIVSPISSTHQLSPLSGSRSDEDIRTEGLDFDFPYRHTGSHSSTSLTSDLRENSASFSADPISPTAPASTPFNFSSDPNAGAFSVEHNNISLEPTAPDFQHREKRSNTFPSINLDYANQVANTDPVTPRHPSVTAASIIDSPSNDTQSTPFTIETTLTSPPALRRTSSNSSMTTRSNGTSVAGSAISSSTADSSPVSPTQEEARRAANTLLSYIKGLSNGVVDQNEYMTVVQLTKKLHIQQHQTLRSSIGGLSRIPEGDGELPMPTDALAMMEAR